MTRLITVAAVFSTIFRLSWSADWPQWRGPARDGVAAGVELPESWPSQLRLEWKAEVGEGHASPVVVDSGVFVHTRVGEDEVLTHISLETGKIVWTSEKHAVSYQMNPAAYSHGKGPKSTPVVAEGKVFTLSITGVLSAFDQTTGKLSWRKDSGGEFPETSPLYGTAMSPLVRGGKVIAHVGGHGKGALRAFDVRDGSLLWTWEGDGPGYASPLILQAESVDQVVTQTEQKIVGVEFGSGRLLWEVPFETPYVQNIVTPLLFEDLVILSGLENEMFAMRLARGDSGAWLPKKVWETRQLAMYMNSPVLKDHLVFGMAHQRKGRYFCLDARSGEVLWATPGREGETVSMVRAAEYLFLLTEDAKLLVIRATGEGYQPVSEYTVADSPTWAHPVPTASRILIKDRNHLASWTWRTEP